MALSVTTGLDDDEYLDLRVAAAKRSKSIGGLVTELIRAYLRMEGLGDDARLELLRSLGYPI